MTKGDTSIKYNTNTKSSVQYLQFQGRTSASAGLWLCALIPLACCPGFYSIHSHCRPSPCILSVLAMQAGVSSIYILYDLHSKSAKNNGGQDKRLPKNWLLYLVTHPYLPVLASFVALSVHFKLDNPVVFISAIICCYLQNGLTRWLFRHFSDSFSTGETLLVGQAASLALTFSVKGVLSLPYGYSEDHQMLLFLQVAVLVSSNFGFILWKVRGKLSLWLFLFVLLAMGGLGIGVSSLVLKEWVLQWIIHIILSPTRMALLGWWTNLSVVIVLTAVISQRYSHIPQTILRKTFHMLVALIIVPGVILDPSLTYFAATAAMILFILLEFIRIANVSPFGNILGSLFSIFLDEKDSGSLVLSHIYLLAGLAVPLWLYPCDFTQTERSPPVDGIPIQHRARFDPYATVQIQYSVLPLLAGVISVGVGDTAASIAGTWIGRHRLPGTKKTFEGCFCSVALQLAFVSGVVYMGSLSLEISQWPKIFLAIVISSLVEAFTDQVDNIILPLILYTPFMDP